MSIISQALKKAEQKDFRRESIPLNLAAPVSTKHDSERICWTPNWEAFTCWALVTASCLLLIGLFQFPAPHPAFAINAGRVASISNPLQTGYATGAALLPLTAGPTKGKSPEYRLTGVTVSPEGSRYAIINGTVVQTGTYIDGAYVESISGNQVVLKTAKGDFMLQVSS